METDRKEMLILRHYYGLLKTLKEADSQIGMVIEESSQNIFHIAPKKIVDSLVPIKNLLESAIKKEEEL